MSKSRHPYVSGTLILDTLERNSERPDYITSFSELKPGDMIIITDELDGKLEIDAENMETLVFKPYYLPLTFIVKKIQVYNNITKTFSKFTINCTWILDKFKREKFLDDRHYIITNNNCNIKVDGFHICISKISNT